MGGMHDGVMAQRIALRKERAGARQPVGPTCCNLGVRTLQRVLETWLSYAFPLVLGRFLIKLVVACGRQGHYGALALAVV
jgi:hypothetical protein